jgi:hypothetical protein
MRTHLIMPPNRSRYTLLLLTHLLGALLVSPQAGHAAILITEVLKNPAGRESEMGGGLSHEFIEILNSGADTLVLDSLFLTDGETVDSVIAWSMPLTQHRNVCISRRSIPPGRCALILDRDYAATSDIRPFVIADSTILLTTSKSSLVGGLTDNKGLLLYKGTLNAIHDSLAGALDPGQEAVLGKRLVHTTPLGTPDGFSLEPRTILFPATQWQPSPDSLSPGFWPPIEQGWLAEYRPHANSGRNTILCSLFVYCPGRTTSSTVNWNIVNTTNTISVASGELAVGNIPFGFNATLPIDTIAYRLLLADETKTIWWNIDISEIISPQNPIRINEISPRAVTGSPEWLELINVSTMPINLKNWRLAVGDGITTIISNDCILQPQAYCIVTNNRLLLTNHFVILCDVIQVDTWQYLDNYRDTVKLFNQVAELPTDIIFYSSSWFESFENQSIERVSAIDSNATTQEKWVLSTNPSPGQPNTSVIWRSVSSATLTIGPIPFTPNGDGKDDVLLIGLSMPANASAIISIYGFDGRKLIDYKSITAPKLFWDGRTGAGTITPVGPFFVVAEIIIEGKKSSIRHKGILWR